MPTESIAELARLAPDVYGFRYENHVALFIVTDEGVILADPIGQVNPHTPSVIGIGCVKNWPTYPQGRERRVLRFHRRRCEKFCFIVSLPMRCSTT